MKILIIRNFPSYMDIKNNTYNIQEIGLAKALVRKGNICDVILWCDRNESEVRIPVDKSGKVRVFYRRGKTLLKNTIFTECRDLFERYDILQPCEYNQMQAWYLAKHYPDKTVIYHGPYYSPFNKRYNLMCKIFDAFFLNTYITNSTKFIVKSEMAEDFLIKKGINSDNIITVGVGIDMEMLSNGNVPCKGKVLMQMRQDADKLRVLYVGRFEERRNLIFILDVFDQLYKQNNNARLYLIGTGEKEYIRNVFQYAEDIGIKKAIVWEECIEQKYLSEIYALADFFLLPTEYEIFGMVLLEAMLYKTVVLTTNNGGSGTLIQNNKNGFIINETKAELWADKMIEVYEDDQWKAQVQAKASETIKEHFTWDALVERFLEQYEKCMDCK